METIIKTLNKFLPLELVYIIIFKYNAIENPHAYILKYHMKHYVKKDHCWYCKKNNVSLVLLPKSYISHHSFSPFQKIVYEKENKIPICWSCAH